MFKIGDIVKYSVYCCDDCENKVYRVTAVLDDSFQLNNEPYIITTEGWVIVKHKSKRNLPSWF